MKFKNILKSMLLGLVMAGGLTSCDDSFIFEGEGDCSPKVQFVFKKHRQALHSIPGREADVFSSTVGSVHLFVYDASTGELVFEKSENTDALKSEADLNLGNSTARCYMPVDLAPGTYKFVAWCGLNESDDNNAFSLEEGTRAGRRYDECKVKTDEGDGNPVHHEKYESIYHGVVHSATVTFDNNGGSIIPVELTKNNNDISVWVQHTGGTFEEGDYEVVYTDRNGGMHFEDNSMTRDNKLEYRAYKSSVLNSSVSVNDNTIESGALVAHISTARLMESHSEDARLEVRDKEGKTVFSIPFIKYMAQLQTLTNDNQYYLDCEDTYNCSFYLTGEGDTWMPWQIIINNWVVVPEQHYDE